MTCTRSWTRGAGLLALLLAAAPAPAAPAPAGKSGLEQVPATAPIVVYLRGVEGTRDRLVALLENALPDLLQRVKPQLDSWVKEGIEGRKLVGVPKNGPIFLVFTEMPRPGGGQPKVAVVLAVNNYAEFRDGLLKEDERKDMKNNGKGVDMATLDREAVFFVDRKGYAVVTPDEEVANSFTKQRPGLDTRLSKELASKLLAADLAGYLSMDVFNKDYAEQIKQFREAAQDGIKQALQQAGKTEKRVIDMVEGAVGTVFQAAEDSQGALLTVEFRPGGLAIHAESEVRAGTPTAASLEGARPAAFTDMGRLPTGRAYYTALQTRNLLKGLGGMLFGAVADPDSPEGKAAAEAVQELIKAGPGERLDSASLPPEGLQAWFFDDPAKAASAQLKLFKAMAAGGTVQSGTLKEKPVIKEKAEKYGDAEFSSVHLVWDLDKMVEQAAAGKPLPEQTKQQLLEGFKKTLGEELTVWVGTDGTALLQVNAKDWKTATRLLDQYTSGKRGAGSGEAFRNARKEMPRDTSVLALVDVVQLFVPITEMVRPMIPIPLPPGYPAMPEKGSAGFLGFAATLEPRGGGLDIFVSAEAARAVYESFVKPLRGGQ